MSEYFTGEEILREWGLQGFELFEYVRRGLKPYDKTGRLYNAPTEDDVRANLEDIKAWLPIFEDPEFPKHIKWGNYWETKPHLTYKECRSELIEDYKDINEKLKKIQMDENLKIEHSWKYCILPDDNKRALKLIDSIVDSIYLKSDVKSAFGLKQNEDNKNKLPDALVSLIKKAKPEIEFLYPEIKKIDWADLGTDKRWRIGVLSKYDNNKNKFSIVTRSHLERVDYTFSQTKEKRDFIGKLLQILIRDNGFKNMGIKRLYKIYIESMS